MRRTRQLRLLAVTVLTCLFAMLPGVEIAEGGGSWLDPVQDRYEAGERATLVGYTGGNGDDEPYRAFLYRQHRVDRPFHPRAIPLYVGELEVTKTGDQGYLATRVALTFELPDFLEPGVYWIKYCTAESCQEFLGDLIGGFFNVGIDPEYPVSREWPVSEPEVQNLADDALLVGPGWTTTAADIRAD